MPVNPATVWLYVHNHLRAYNVIALGSHLFLNFNIGINAAFILFPVCVCSLEDNLFFFFFVFPFF